MSVCGGNNCSKRSLCKHYKNNYFKYNDEDWAQYIDWSMYGSGGIGTDENGNSVCHETYYCGDFSETYPFFKEIAIDYEKLKLIDQAIESAKCRIYRLKANPGSTETHQKKAENQQELMKITIEALERFKQYISQGE